jgi:hypothetical protein
MGIPNWGSWQRQPSIYGGIARFFFCERAISSIKIFFQFTDNQLTKVNLD